MRDVIGEDVERMARRLVKLMTGDDPDMLVNDSLGCIPYRVWTPLGMTQKATGEVPLWRAYARLASDVIEMGAKA